MSEAEFRRKVVRALAPLAAFPVENVVRDGVPDVALVTGWLELKVGRVPLRSGPVRVGLRDSQRVWLRRWRMHGGHAWTLIELENSIEQHVYLLHDAHDAVEMFDSATYEQLVQSSLARWLPRLEPDGLIAQLVKPLPRIR